MTKSIITNKIRIIGFTFDEEGRASAQIVISSAIGDDEKSTAPVLLRVGDTFEFINDLVAS